MNNFLILIVGAPKTGKTVSACTFPKPMLVLDYDDGLTSIQYATDSSNNLVVTEQDQIYSVDFNINSNFPLYLKTPEKSDFDKLKAPDYTKNSIDLISKYNKIIDELFKDQCIPSEFIGQPAGKRIGPFKSLVIDPLSTVFRIWSEAIINFNRIPALRLADYKTLDGILFGQFLPTLKSLKTKIPWIICINHEATNNDQATGIITEFPVGPSDNMGRIMGKDFCAILRSRYENGKFIWRTKPHGRFASAGSRINLSDNIEANYESIRKVI